MAKLHQHKDGSHWSFQCPGCKSHHTINDTWGIDADDPDRPTVTASIMVNRDGKNPTVPICHSFVRDGKIEFLHDCTHELKGQTMELPEWSGAYE